MDSISQIDVIEGRSIAMYSTWFIYKPDNLLFDVGEGFATTLKNKVFGIQSLFLSHGHVDHTAGLPVLFQARSGGLGSKDTHLNIYYPAHDEQIINQKHYLEAAWEGSFPRTWIPIESGFTLPLKSVNNQPRRIEAFQTVHIPVWPTLGYKILEQRNKLKSIYKDLSQEAKRQLILECKDESDVDSLFDLIETCTFLYSGDTNPLPVEIYGKPEILMHECTSILPEDYKGKRSHTLWDDLLELVVKINPKVLVLYHFSGRYSQEQIKPLLYSSGKLEALSPTFPIYFIYESHRDVLWIPPVLN